MILAEGMGCSEGREGVRLRSRGEAPPLSSTPGTRTGRVTDVPCCSCGGQCQQFALLSLKLKSKQ